MARYRISSNISSAVLGIYDGEDEQSALDAMARDAGYKDHAEVEREVGTQPGELLVERISHSVRVTDIQGHHCSSVDDEDRLRAEDAAEAVLWAAGVDAREAEADYRRQWLAYDDEDPMTGEALVWIEARRAADVALTSTWSNPEAEVFCDIEAA